MASIKYIIAKRGGDRPEVILRLTIDSSLKVQSKVPGVLVYRQYWSEPKQCNDTSRKFIKPWEVQEMTAINKTLANLAAEILTRATATAEENITRSWLMAEIDNILHPDKNAPKKEAPKTLMQAVNDLIDGAPTRIVQHTGKPVNARTQIHYKQMRNHLTAFLNEHELADLDLADWFACAPDGRFRCANPAFAEMFGFDDEEEACKANFSDLMPDDPLPALFERALEGEKAAT